MTECETLAQLITDNGGKAHDCIHAICAGVSLGYRFLPNPASSEFQRLGETGLIAPDARLELIDGELFEMAPIGCFHAGTVGILTCLLARAIADTAMIHV